MTDLTTAYDGTIERTADGGVIRFERHLPYAVADVWAAVTDPARLADWWLPFDADITVDLREGGEMVFAAKDGEPPPMTMTILRIEAPTFLEHTHVDPDERLRWELEPTDVGTILRLSHFVTDADAAIERCYVVGLHTSLGRLEPALSGAPTAWDWDEFATSQSAYAAQGSAPPVEP